MRIHELRVSNFKRIEALTISFPESGVTEICGRNAQGKSSAIDAIWSALGGKAASPDHPIRSGAHKGQVELTLDSLKVVRDWTSNGTKLTVTNADGYKVARPQELLDKLYERLGFDPLAFLHQRPAEQSATLRQITGLDFTDLDAKREEIAAERKEVKKAIDVLEKHLVALPEVPEVTPIDTGNLHQQIKETSSFNANVASARAVADRQANVVERFETEIEELRRQAEEIEKKIESKQKKLDEAINLQFELEGEVGEIVLIQPLLDQISQADEINQQAKAYRERVEAEEQLRGCRADWEDFDLQLDEIEGARKARLAKARFPVPGLSIEKDEVTFEGHPLRQASSAEQIRVSLAICAGLNPELRLLIIKEGSLLDEVNLGLIAKWATEHDYQVIVERVANAPHGFGFVIEEGRLGSAPKRD